MNHHDEPTDLAPEESGLATKVPYILTLCVLIAAAYGGSHSSQGKWGPGAPRAARPT